MNAHLKAEVLVEALPYIRRWAGKSAVLKVGGEILDSPERMDLFAADVALLRTVGLSPVIVHGGGAQISEAMRREGKEPVFAHGLRVTDAETRDIVRRVLVEEINAGLVDAIRSHGGDAAGVSGEEGPLFVVRPLRGPAGEDLGFVGEIDKVNAAEIEVLLSQERIPVVASLGWGPDGTHNVNADTAAGALAASIGAQKAVFLTNAPGLLRDVSDPATLISEVSAGELKDLLAQGTLTDGMIPKAAAALECTKSGIPQVHILDGRVPHAVLLEIFTAEGIGTMVVP